MAKFFINRPIVAIVIAIVMVIVGVVASSVCRLPSIPHRSSGNRHQHHLRRRGRADGGAVGRDPDRTGDERRRQPELHVFAQCQ